MMYGWNAYPAGRTVDWALARQGMGFVYLGADGALEQARTDAKKAGLLVGGYWSLQSDIDPAGQAKLFLNRWGKLSTDDLPPAVWVYEARQLPTLKLFVEALEKSTQRRTLIGGTPESLQKAGLIFGRTNPLWISHKPLFGGPKLPVGWTKYALWQTTANAQAKGVQGQVGLNIADSSFISESSPAFWAFVVAGLAALYAVRGVKEATK